ncbi:unnamed protein product [Moneuplotes crassus]|uniref:Uncharacterized protein n=1 Tax=Euplotes crassus TaxID=5936 RepID=A0AAD1XNN4_EUPCR|nr:unnamed protein product [Moneuplotes crassus]
MAQRLKQDAAQKLIVKRNEMKYDSAKLDLSSPLRNHLSIKSSCSPSPVSVPKSPSPFKNSKIMRSRKCPKTKFQSTKSVRFSLSPQLTQQKSFKLSDPSEFLRDPEERRDLKFLYFYGVYTARTDTCNLYNSRFLLSRHSFRTTKSRYDFCTRICE